MNTFNIFEIVPSYKAKWSEKDSRSFTEAELALCSKGKVVNSDYGFSLECVRADGTTHYLPISHDNPCGIGDIVDLHTARLITLEKPGEKDIYRVDF